MGLALLARGGQFYFVGEDRLLLRRNGQRGLQVEGDGELAVLVGAGLAKGDLLILDGRVPPPPATPREGGLADDAIAVFHIIQAETGVSFYIAMHRNFLVQFVLLFWLLKSDLESRAFVFLHTDGGAASVGIEVEHAIQPVGGNNEGATERAVFVGSKLRQADFLPVGIAEGNLFRIAVDEADILTLTARHDALEIDGLSRTVNGTVGEELGTIGLIIVFVSLIKAEVVIGQQVVITFAQVDIERIAACFGYFSLAILVCFWCGDNDSLVFSGFVVPLAAIDLHGDAFHGLARLAIDRHHGHLVVFCIGDKAKTRHLEVQYQRLILALDAFCGSSGQEVEATIQSGQGNQGAVLAVIGLGSQTEFLFVNGVLFAQLFQPVFFVHVVQLLQLFLADLHYSIIRCSRVAILQHSRDGFVRQLYRIQRQVDLRFFNAFDKALAILCALRFRELGDGFLAHRLGFLIIVEISAVLAVALILVHQVPCNQRGDFGGERIVLMLGFQVLHRSLVSVIFSQDGVNETKTLEVVVNQYVLVLVLEVVGDEVLIDLQAFAERVIGRTQVNLHKILGGQPPGIGRAFHVVGIGLTLIVVGHAVEHELKQRGLVFDVFLVVVLVFVQRHEILGLGLFQCLDGLQGLIVMLVDAGAETLLVPVFHLHLGNVAVNGQILVDAPFVRF